MAIVLNTTPGTYQSAQGEILFTAYEATKAIDPITYPNYKYVCDVYIAAALIARQKAFPYPTNYRGKFDIGTIVRNYLALQFNPSTGIKAQEFGEGEFKITAQCKFGEEYDGVLYADVTEDSSRTYYNHYNGLLIGDNTILDSYSDKIASVRPVSVPIDLLSAKHFVPYFPSTTAAFDVEIKTYGFDNALITTQTDSFSAAADNNLIIFNVAPAAINSVHASLINSGIKLYTIKFGTTSIYTFEVLSNCKYTTITLHFLNKFGGFESYDFILKSQKSIQIEKKDFGRLGYEMDASGNINYNTSNGVIYEERSVYASQYTQRLSINSDWLTDDEYTWLAELMLSPLIYVEQASYLVPVVTSQTEYMYKKRIDEHLTNITVNIEYGARLNAQYR